MEAERGRIGACKYLRGWQQGKLLMPTQEQCWHKNEWVETSRNERLEM